jgi:hypothetical protein
MKEIIEYLRQPENLASVAAVLVGIGVAVRGLGELFLAIGNLNKKPDKWDSVGRTLCNLSTKLGKLLTFLGVGNDKALFINKPKEVK